MGTVGILNVGAGDTKLTFDKDNPIETARASRIVKDMLRRGYALFIEIGQDEKGQPKYRRAHDFDETTAEYIIADFDPLHGQDEEQTDDHPIKQGGAAAARGAKAKGRKTRVPAESTSAVAVARTAGG